jgi:hypothetical protein
MKLQKPNLHEDNDNNLFMPMKPQNNLENKILKKKVDENLSPDINIDISIVKYKKKQMLKKFSLLDNRTKEANNFSKNPMIETAIYSQKSFEKEFELIKKEEKFKEKLNKKLGENLRSEQLFENPIVNNREKDDKIVFSKIDNYLINDIKEGNKEALAGKDISNNKNKIIKLSEDNIEAPKQRELNDNLNVNNHLESKEEDSNKTHNQYTKQEFSMELEKKESIIIYEDYKDLNDNEKKQIEEKFAKPQENQTIKEIKDEVLYDKITTEAQKSNETEKNKVNEENSNLIKIVKKIEFNDEEEEEKEKINERKSKDFLAKKKDFEKIKALKNKAKNSSNTIKPRLSVNTGAKKTLNFDEEDD